MLILHADGGCQPNPGDGTYGVVAIENGSRIYTCSQQIGYATNNIAEWRGAIAALEYALAGEWREVELRMDSRMVVMQLNGRWKVKHPGLKPLAAKGAAVLAKLRERGTRVVVNWIGREYNAEADKAAGEARAVNPYAPIWSR